MTLLLTAVEGIQSPWPKLSLGFARDLSGASTGFTSLHDRPHTHSEDDSGCKFPSFYHVNHALHTG
ncbi:hypothetical protein PV350_25010 [Streptomyces sp. PA03-6a]|nr:hypothetical protein [Streptomyces sp. PA03-6a]